MARVAAENGTQLTTELVIQSAGALTLDDVYGPYNVSAREYPSVFQSTASSISADIYNVQPGLGYYCLYRSRPGQAPAAPDCDNTYETAAAHAAMLVAAGIDYVAIDVTNWPMADVGGSTDVSVLRPTEVLFEEWAKVRAAGGQTPAIAVWPCSPAGGTTWKYLVDELYNNETYQDLVYKQDGKKVVFVPHAGSNCYDYAEAQLIENNGGRNDIRVIPMWALFGDGGGAAWDQGVWGFFSPCVDAAGDFTTSMVDTGPCNQFSTQANGTTNDTVEISASGGYMVSQCALPYASPGHMRGLTLARLFEKVLEKGAPHLFLSSFNEHIGGRQGPASGAKIGFNQGLPFDPQRDAVWVDTYASEFSRDVEPSVEGGNRTFAVFQSCVRLYKANATCSDAPFDELCCSRADKDVWSSIWSLRNEGAADSLLTNSSAERAALVAEGTWTERCAAIPNPTAFCVDTNDVDGRAGPFLLYNSANVEGPRFVGDTSLTTVALYRCITAAARHFFSIDATCESLGTSESVLGYMSTRPGLETLRALRRCGGGGEWTHALDAPCDTPDPAFSDVLGYVR